MATGGWQDVTLADVTKRELARQRAHVPQKRRSKYGAVKTTVDGIVFDSKREAARYVELEALGFCGQIRNLELQPRFPLTVNGWKLATYVADFRYEERLDALHYRRVAAGTVSVENVEEWRDVVEDVKGVKTPVYRLKKKLMHALYGITITEV